MTKILFFHHHPFMHNNNPFMELKDAYGLMRTIYCRVDVPLFGHKDVSMQWKDYDGIPKIDKIRFYPDKLGKNDISYARKVS